MHLNRDAPFQIYVNLGTREDRRVKVERQFRELGLDVLRQPGIRKERVNDPWGFKSASRYACSLAKRLAIRRAKLAGAEAMVLFEDDLILAPDLHERLAEIDLPDDWGIFFLGCKHIERPVPIARNLLRVTRATDNHAVVIRAKYFQAMIRALSGTGKGRKGTIPYSDAQASLIQRHVPTYAAFPNLAWQDFSLSDNEGAHVTYYDPGGRQRSRREAIEGLEEEIESKFGSDVSNGRTRRKAQRIADPDEVDVAPSYFRRQTIETIISSCYYLNRGTDEIQRWTMEREFAAHRLAVTRMAVPPADGDHKRGEKKMRLMVHWMAIRKARGEGAVAVMVFEDELLLDRNFRKWMENSEIPKDWEILVMESASNVSDGRSPGWEPIKKFGKIGAYAVRRNAFRKVMNEIARTYRRCNGPCEMAKIFASMASRSPVHGWSGALVRTKDERSTNLMKWMVEFREARLLSKKLPVLPSFEERNRIIGDFGVDVFADAFHRYMRTGKALVNE